VCSYDRPGTIVRPDINGAIPIACDQGRPGNMLEQVWMQTSADLATVGEGAPHVFATGSDHYIQVLQPDLVTDTAVLVIDRAAR
jgi:hypothetical protein